MSRLVVSFMFAAALLLGAAIDGKWKGEMGEGREVVFTLKDDGGKVKGTMSGPDGEPRPITQGEWKGENIAFTVASEWQGSPFKLLVKGTVTGNEMKLRVESEGGDWGTDAVSRRSNERDSPRRLSPAELIEPLQKHAARECAVHS